MITQQKKELQPKKEILKQVKLVVNTIYFNKEHNLMEKKVNGMYLDKYMRDLNFYNIFLIIILKMMVILKMKLLFMNVKNKLDLK